MAIAEGYVFSDVEITEIAPVLLGECPGRASPDAITLYESLGLAVQDLMSSVVAYKRAMASG